MVQNRFKSIHFLKILRNIFILGGIFFLASIALAFTSLPYRGIHWLGTSKSEMKRNPKAIVLMGGSGMPSESNLMRSWYAGKAARTFPDATLVIAMPGEITDSLGTPQKLKKELVLRGAGEQRIIFENKGTNTRAQALNCKKLLKEKESVLLITSPAHARRSILSFRKAGFEKVNALPAFENAAEADFSFRDDKLGGNNKLIPAAGRNISMRYQIWNHLKYEIAIAREGMALLYYKCRGWI
jgi:uncharacterized SAM-binding protein YcdF (DUF218 family)